MSLTQVSTGSIVQGLQVPPSVLSSIFQVFLKDQQLVHEYGYTKIWKVAKLDIRMIGNGDPESSSRGIAKLYAIKRFAPFSKRQRSAIEKAFPLELQNLCTIPKHQRILPFLGTFTERSIEDIDVAWDLVFPFAEGGDLYTFLREQKPLWVREIAKRQGISAIQVICREILGLAEALEFIHNKDNIIFVIHRDIKPSNILIHDSMFKLADFGISRVKNGEETSKTEWMTDTPMYRAPERDAEDLSGRPRDVWALGCVFLELAVMITYDWLGDQSHAVETFEEARKASGNEHTAAYWRNMNVVGEWLNYMAVSLAKFSDDEYSGMFTLLQVIADMLNVDPRRRPTARNVYYELRMQSIYTAWMVEETNFGDFSPQGRLCKSIFLMKFNNRT